MRAEHLKAGDYIIVPWAACQFDPYRIIDIQPSLTHPGYLTFFMNEGLANIDVPAKRELVLYSGTPMLS